MNFHNQTDANVQTRSLIKSFCGLEKGLFFVYYQIWYIFLISFPGASIRGGGNCPPSFTFQFHLLPCWLVHRSSYLLRRSHCEVNYKYSIISFSSGSLWFRNFRQFSVAVKKMASEHARITNSKQHFGGFLTSISAQVWRNITKNTKNADFKKTGPPAAPRLLAPLSPLGVKKIFWVVSGIYLSSSLKKYHQKYKECRV